jgi:rod shape-determining protein MreD
VIVTRAIVLRIALLVLGGVVLQLSFLSQISFFGGTPDVMPVIVVCLGLLGGAVIGAVCGFAAGLLLDSALLQTLGVFALVLLAVGYLAGRYREGFDISNPLVPPAIAAGLTLFGSFAFALIQLMLGVEAPVSVMVVRDIVLQAVLGFVLMVPVFPFVRRVLRSALIDAPARRRPGLRRPFGPRSQVT